MYLSGHNIASGVFQTPQVMFQTKSLKTILDHKERILRALSHIEHHIEDPLRLKNLAEVACLSNYHFHRSFSYYVGDTVAGYVRKRRLAKAAVTLKKTDNRIIDVAFEAGYETVEAFTKAFKRAYGVPPSVYKKNTKNILTLLPKRVSAILLKPCSGNQTHPSCSRKALRGLSRLSCQIQLQKNDSTWMSVFPDLQTVDRTDNNNQKPYWVTLGQLRYQLIFPTSHAEFQIVKCGTRAVLHYNDEAIVYRKATRVVPPTNDHHLQHLALPPIGMRSILCTAN